MDLTGMPRSERESLARDPRTDPAVLAALAHDVYLLPTLVANPSTPAPTRDAAYRDFAHLRGQAPNPATPQEDAFDRIRRRQLAADATYARRLHDAATAAATVTRPYGGPARGTNGFAIASLVVALVGSGIVAVVLGHVAKSQLRRTGESGDGLATAGLVLGYAQLAIGAVVVLAVLSHA